VSRAASLTLALVIAVSPTPAAPTPKEVKAKSVLDRVKPVGIGGLIEQPTARGSLKLTKEQEEKLAAARTEIGGSLTAIAKAQQNVAGAAAGKLDAIQEMVDKMSDVVLGYDAKVLEVLTDEQAKRVKQLHLQREGPAGLVSRYAVRELGLSPEQEDKLADTVAPLHKPKIFDMLSTAIAQPGMPDVDKLVAARAAKIDGVRDEALKHLTADQKKKWKEMLGEEVPTAELVRGSAEAFVYKLSMEFAK
jgi:hypothetical protein